MNAKPSKPIPPNSELISLGNDIEVKRELENTITLYNYLKGLKRNKK
jgi:hypothetical protein